MEPKIKMRFIEVLQLMHTIAMIIGVVYILILDNFQFFFNWHLMLFMGVFIISGFFLNRERQNAFEKTL
jgi:hypothetical protein